MNTKNRSIFPADTVIFQEGDEGHSAYLLRSGKVEISTLQNGVPVVLTTVSSNQIFGELALIDGSLRSATATAVTTCEALVIHQEDFESRLEKSDEFMKYWVKYLTERIRDLSKRVQD